MIIQEKLIRINNIHHKPKQFIIERFNVPENLNGIHIHMGLPEDWVKCVFVYDQDYELRAEYDVVKSQEVIRIYETEEETSLRAKAGPVSPGEWIFAIEVEPEISEDIIEIGYYIEGIEKARTF